MSSQSASYAFGFNKDGSLIGVVDEHGSVIEQVPILAPLPIRYDSPAPIFRRYSDQNLQFWSPEDSVKQQVAAVELSFSALPKSVREAQIKKWSMETDMTDVSSW
jgi:hypothetical protein